MFEHGVERNQQFAHGRDQRHLFRLTSCQQLLVEVPDSRVVAAGYQRSHVRGRPAPGSVRPRRCVCPAGCRGRGCREPRPQGRRSAGDPACPIPADAPARSAIAVGPRREPCGAGHPSHATLDSGAKSDVAPYPSRSTLVPTTRCGLQCDVGFNAGTNGAAGGTQPVLLGDQHAHHLVPAGSQRVEDLGLGVLEGAHGGTDGVGEMGQDPRVQSVGLGQRSGGLGEVPDLAWVEPPPPAVPQRPGRPPRAAPSRP